MPMHLKRPSPFWDDEGWLGLSKRYPSPNCDARPRGLPIDLLVIHHISLPPGRFSGDAVRDLFLNQLEVQTDPFYAQLLGLKVSAHFFIRRSGQLLQFVACDQRAWHAGKSSFEGRKKCNDFSIGIELEGDGEHQFTKRQYARLALLTKRLLARYPLKNIVGHSDIAPGRKTDPGPYFDWPGYGDRLQQLSSQKQRKIFSEARLVQLAESLRQRVRIS